MTEIPRWQIIIKLLKTRDKENMRCSYKKSKQYIYRHRYTHRRYGKLKVNGIISHRKENKI
jgi:hypothetical protein